MGRGFSSGSKPENVVPVFARRTESLDGGMKLHHGMGHSFARVIEIEAAIEEVGLADQLGEPDWVGSRPRRGEAAILRVKGMATDRINGRFA